MLDAGSIIILCATHAAHISRQAIAGYILFDTRMDFPEAHQSPLDPSANEGWRSAKVPALPQDLFMIVRVVTLLRGVMSSLGVDVSSSLMWRPLALETIAELGGRCSLNADPAAPTSAAASASASASITVSNEHSPLKPGPQSGLLATVRGEEFTSAGGSPTSSSAEAKYSPSKVDVGQVAGLARYIKQQQQSQQHGAFSNQQEAISELDRTGDSAAGFT